MKIKVDLSKFKLRSRDEHKAVLEHPDGHTFNVAIKALHPENRKNLDSLKMADGGEVKGKQSSGPNLDPDKLKQFQDNSIFNSSGKKKQDSAQPRMYAEGTPGAPVGEDDSIPLNINAPQVSDALVNPNPGSMQSAPIGTIDPASVPKDSYFQSPEQFAQMQEAKNPSPAETPVPEAMRTPSASGEAPPVSAPQSDANAVPQSKLPPSPIDALTQAYNSNLGAISDESKILQQKAKEEETAFKAKALAEDKLKTDHDTNLTNMMTEVETLRKAIKKGQINPNNYMGSLSTGGKIATAIGLALGGIGGGTNQALEFVNRQIDRDIDAQKAELGKKETLLSSLSRLYGDQVTGEHMTRAILNDQALAHVQEAEAKAASPLAKTRAQQLGTQFKMQIVPAIQKAALTQTLANSAGQNGEPSNQMLESLRILDPSRAKEMEARLVPGVGLASVPIPADDRRTLIAKQTLDTMANDFYNWAKKHSGSLNPADINIGKTKAAELQSLYRNSINGGVFKKGEQEFIDQIVDSDPTKFFNSVRVLPKLKEVIDSNNSQLNIMKKGFGLPHVDSSSSSSEIKNYNGSKYRKVPGGWDRIK